MTHPLEHSSESQAPVAGKPRRYELKGLCLLETDEPLLAMLSEADQAVLRTTGSYEERHKKLQVPMGTLRSRLHRARAKLLALRKQVSPQTQ